MAGGETLPGLGPSGRLIPGKRELPVIGHLMRLYRRSPLHPRLGAALSRALGWVTAWMPSPRQRVIQGLTWELDLREVIDASMYFSGSFEPRAEAILASSLPAGGIAVDVGANIGYHALRMAKTVGPTGRVVAVVPSPRALGRLARNVSLNNLANMTVVAAALGDHDEDSCRLTVQSSFPLSGRAVPETAVVRLLTLDSLIRELALRRLDLLKIDVDGHEARVFRGAGETLRVHRPVVFFELWPAGIRANGDDVEAPFQLLRALGYCLWTEKGAALPDPMRYVRSLAEGAGCNLLAKPSAQRD